MGETILATDLLDDGQIPVYSATESETIFGFVNTARVTLRKGDIIISARGNSIGHVNVVKERCTTTQTTIYSKLQQANSVLPDFVAYYFRAFREVLFFFDRTATKIDVLVAKMERLIALLQEKRAALITRAVTKGLPSTGSGQATPNVPMKDSGVEWLGKIPAHWDVAPVYSRYEVALGKMLDAKRVTGEHLAPYLRNVDVQWDRVNVENLPEMDFHPEESGRYGLRPGDLLVCEGGEVGRTAMWRGELKECFYQKAIHRVRPLSEKDVPRYFYYVMYAAAGRGVFVAGGNPNTIDHLTAIQLRHYRLPFPTKEEQAQIVAALDEETVKIDTLAAKIREGIEKLKEYRTALISAAVTGKIDAREEISSRMADSPERNGASTK